MFVLSIVFAFGFMNTSNVYADVTVSNEVSEYFKLDNSFNARFNPEGLNLDVNKNNSIDNDGGYSKVVKFENNLIVNDLDITMKLPESAVTSFRIDIASHYVNGNPVEYSKADTEGTDYDKTIENIINMSFNADKSKVIVKLNGVELGEYDLDTPNPVTPNSKYFTLKLRVQTVEETIDQVKYVRNYLTIGEFDIRAQYNADQKIYYQIKNIDDKAIATDIELDFRTDSTSTETFVLASVDQKASDTTGAYKQSLAIPADQNKLTLAKPRIYLNDSFYLRKVGGEYTTVKVAYNKTYTLNIKSCSLLGGFTSLYLISDGYDDILLESNTSIPNEIQFMRAGASTRFAVGGKESDTEVVYEEFTVDVVKAFDYLDSDDNTAPEYVYDEIAYKGFVNAYLNATVVKEDGRETSIGMGTDFEIPSMKDLVQDDVTSYEDLSTSVAYATRTTRTTASSMKFKVNDVGEYEFLVMFGDGKKAMKADDFYSVDDDDDNAITYGKYEDYIFRFEIKDDADIIVKAPAIQGDGYLGVKYTASKFTIDADGRTLKYELFYNAKKDVKDADDAGWIAIPQASLISDKTYNEDGFDYDEIQEIAYNGKLMFTPTRIGSYMIKCTASSTTSPREASATTFISVNSKPAVVKVPSDWLERNVWSVVFLGVGSLCLVGIIVLLCIKPKETVDND